MSENLPETTGQSVAKDAVVAKEVAEHEFYRFAAAMDLDVSTKGLDEDDTKSLEQQKAKIVAAIQAGSLVINENGEPVYTPQRSSDDTAIVFHEPTGASLMAMDRKKKTEDIGKFYAAMADMTGATPQRFSKMKMADLKICMAVATLFLA
jgi:hypothetical protein